MTTRAVLFDIDGTLVDSNYLHVEAYGHAFADLGLRVDAWRVHRGIGMDGTQLLESLLGDDAEEVAPAVKELNAQYYSALQPRLRAFDGARELVRELARRQVTVVLATSAPENELEALLGVLDLDDSLAAVTSDADVDTAKPAPDIVQVALSRAGTDATATVLVGDSVWDMKAATAAGVTPVGVLSGGVSASELRDAGAIAVYADVAEILERLDESPLLG
ncbi:HAD family hydrolase [soil metagenome]